ncbi:PPOX class F420-dependent oxidoreductase [Pseudonocardia nematodicida]|uniref:PPOX class F420-dependent oxidoreductase n=1 Tax=Pseudonocardia nematodicida TaxID=1206997 RepID=A0ABV1K6W7_9PSEU
MTSAEWVAMGDAEFVSLTTYRRDGSPVATPMWVALHEGELVFTTPAGSGKVKRLRRDPTVRMSPCSRRGTVAEHAPSVQGAATLDRPGPGVEAALRAKYGWQYTLVLTIERLLARGRRERTIVRVAP